MTTCAAGVAPYSITGPGWVGNTALEACQSKAAWHNANGYSPAAVYANTETICEITYNGTSHEIQGIVRVCDPESVPATTTTATITCAGTCTVTLQHEFNLPALQLTPEQGGQIALAVIAVWVVGWAIRMLVRTLSIDGNSSSNHESESL